jgi:hypothetical protein
VFISGEDIVVDWYALVRAETVTGIN